MGLRWWAVGALLVPSMALGGESIAFLREGNLWLMHADGTDQEQLSHSGKCDHPYWSPDGTSLVFESAGNIWRMRFAGRATTRLTTTGDCHQPAWRPGTDEVWYCRMGPQGKNPDGVPASMWRVSANGRSYGWVFEVKGACGPGRSAWRSDGRALLYDVAVPEGPSTAAYFTDGRHRDGPFEYLVPGQGPFCYLTPSWSPVSPNLVAMGDNNYMRGTTALWLYDMARRTFQAVYQPSRAEGEVVIEWPSWSPDGQKIAVDWTLTRHADVAYQVHSITSISVDGRKVVRLAEDAGEPAWSPVANQGDGA